MMVVIFTITEVNYLVVGGVTPFIFMFVISSSLSTLFALISPKQERR